MTSDNYFKWFLSSCLAVLLSASIFNYIIDPYNIFQTVRLQGINTSKPATSTRTDLAKAHMVTKFAAKTLVVGTSKFDVGINPESNYLPTSEKPAFNLAMPGSGIYKQYRFIQHASTEQIPELIIMSLEFELFLSKQPDLELYPPNPQSKTFEKRLATTYAGTSNQDQWLQSLKDMSASLISNTAILDSITTIMAGDEIWIQDSGFSSGSARFESEISAKGHFSVFRDTMQKQIKELLGTKVHEDSHSFKALDEIIELSKKHNIDLILIIPPYHSFEYELWEKAGLWHEFEQWKQSILLRVDAANDVGSEISLWDFATYNQKSTEDLPPPGNTAEKMEWYWEPLHFKKILGDHILEDIFSSNAAMTGVELTTSNFCQAVTQNRRQKIAYRENNKQQIDLFNLIVSNYLPSDTAISAPKNNVELCPKL